MLCSQPINQVGRHCFAVARSDHVTVATLLAVVPSTCVCVMDSGAASVNAATGPANVGLPASLASIFAPANSADDAPGASPMAKLRKAMHRLSTAAPPAAAESWRNSTPTEGGEAASPKGSPTAGVGSASMPRKNSRLRSAIARTMKRMPTFRFSPRPPPVDTNTQESVVLNSPGGAGGSPEAGKPAPLQHQQSERFSGGLFPDVGSFNRFCHVLQSPGWTRSEEDQELVTQGIQRCVLAAGGWREWWAHTGIWV